MDSNDYSVRLGTASIEFACAIVYYTCLIFRCAGGFYCCAPLAPRYGGVLIITPDEVVPNTTLELADGDLSAICIGPFVRASLKLRSPIGNGQAVRSDAYCMILDLIDCDGFNHHADGIGPYAWSADLDCGSTSAFVRIPAVLLSGLAAHHP